LALDRWRDPLDAAATATEGAIVSEAQALQILAEVRAMRADLARLSGERLGVQQAADVLGVNRETIRRMEADGRIPARGRDGKWVRADLMGVTA
jgi:excisionase family DNA binding protein